MAVANDVGPNIDRFATDSLDRKAPAIDARIHIFDEQRAARKCAD
jgi:hypothetical protein